MSDLGPTQLKNIAEPVRVYLVQVGQPAPAKAAPSMPTAAVGAKSAALPAGGRGFSRWCALAAVLVVVVLAGGYAWRAGVGPGLFGASVAEDKPKTTPRLSIVVPRFENLSGDKKQDDFADGITDDLTTDLLHIADSFVIARDTAFTYKGKAIDAKQIGREIGVRYLLEGSVRRVSEMITINA